MEELQILQKEDLLRRDFDRSSDENEDSEERDQSEGASAAVVKKKTRAQSRRGRK